MDSSDDKYSDDGYEDENHAPNSPTHKSAAQGSGCGGGSGDLGSVSYDQSEQQATDDQQRLVAIAAVELGDGAEFAVVQKEPSKRSSKSSATAMDVAFRAPSHMPSSPRPLSSLPKGSTQNMSVLKLAQRDTHPHELKSALSRAADDNAKSGRCNGHIGANELAVLGEADFSGWTALHWASAKGLHQVARELLRFEERAREDVNSSSGDDGGGMDAKEDDNDGFGLGNEEGGSANSGKLVDRAELTMGSTPLHLAAVGGSRHHFAVARVLVEKGGANLTATDCVGDTPLEVCTARGAALRDWAKLLRDGDVDAATPRLPRSSNKSDGDKHHRKSSHDKLHRQRSAARSSSRR